MALKLPVITTNTTPWSVIDSQQMGWYVSPDLNGISKALYH